MSDKLNIPLSWHYPELGEILDVQGGSQPPKSNFIYNPMEGYIRLLQIRDFGNKPVPTYVPLKKVTKFCEENDVLIARYGASLGRIVTGMRGAYNVALAKVIDELEVFNNRYLFYLLQTATFQTPLAMLSRSAQNGFAKHEISHIRLPLPPLAEQHRIVAKIEELFSELDKGIETLKTAQQQLKVYRQAVLKYAFEGMTQVAFDDLIQSTQNGISKRKSDSGIEYKVLRLADISNFKVDNSESRSILLSDKEIESYKIADGDLLCIRVNGSKDLVGGLVYVDKSDENKQWCYCDHFIRIKVNKHKLNPKFVNFYFKTALVRKYIHDNMVTSAGQNTVNRVIIKNVLVPYTNLNEQNKIVQEIESRLSVCDKIEESIEQGLLQAESLRQSILKKAFEGKLVAQDPNDEPASVLLARIKAEREASPEKKARTRKAKA